MSEIIRRARALYGRGHRRVAAWRLRRRRARRARRRAPGRRAVLLLGLVALLFLGAFFWSLDFLRPEPSGAELSLDELTALARNERIASATFRDEDNLLVGTFSAEVEEQTDDDRGEKADGNEGTSTRAEEGEDKLAGGKDQKRNEGQDKNVPTASVPSDAGRYWVAYPRNGAAFSVLLETVSGSGARVSVDSQTTKTAVRAISTYLLPLLILASVFGLLFAGGKGAGSAIGEVITFGTIGKKRTKKGMVAPTTFADVGSADEAVAELKEVVDYLKDPERYEEIGALPPKGVLLFGPPGCGKTLLAKAVAGEAQVPFFSVAGAEFVESLVGVGAARIRDLFQRVRAVAPAIVFIDELDAAGRRRAPGGGESGTDEREQTLNQLLVEMDGFEIYAGIVVVGATNRADILDPALLRPGRFDRHITVELPDLQGRKEILELHARGKPIAESVDFDHLAKRTPGFSGADLANVINEAALLSVRENKDVIGMAELDEAIQRVLYGPKKKGRLLTAEEERRAAFHESGHAVVAAALGRADDVHRVSILARGRGIGTTALHQDGNEPNFLSSAQLYEKLVIQLGGLAAERLVFGDVSTGSEQDLEGVTELARDMIGRYGMSPVFGRARLMLSDVEQFFGGGSALSELAVTTHQDFDKEVARLLDSAETDALRLLELHREVLDELAIRLEVEETLEGAAVMSILRRVPRAMIANPLLPPSPDGAKRLPTPASGPIPNR